MSSTLRPSPCSPVPPPAQSPRRPCAVPPSPPPRRCHRGPCAHDRRQHVPARGVGSDTGPDPEVELSRPTDAVGRGRGSARSPPRCRPRSTGSSRRASATKCRRAHRRTPRQSPPLVARSSTDSATASASAGRPRARRRWRRGSRPRRLPLPEGRGRSRPATSAPSPRCASRYSRLSPRERAAAERAELTAAARSVAKVWLIRHEIQGVPLPDDFLRGAPRGRDRRPDEHERAQAPAEVQDPQREAGPATEPHATTAGPATAQMIAWGWRDRRQGQALWADRLHTTSAGTAITDMVRVVNRNTGYDREDHAGPYIVLDISDFTFEEWWRLMKKHLHTYKAPVVLHPVLVKKFFPYLDDDASGHFQVGRGYDKTRAARRCWLLRAVGPEPVRPHRAADRAHAVAVGVQELPRQPGPLPAQRGPLMRRSAAYGDRSDPAPPLPAGAPTTTSPRRSRRRPRRMPQPDPGRDGSTASEPAAPQDSSTGSPPATSSTSAWSSARSGPPSPARATSPSRARRARTTSTLERVGERGRQRPAARGRHRGRVLRLRRRDRRAASATVST